jgi:hypothetical protein
LLTSLFSNSRKPDSCSSFKALRPCFTLMDYATK